jgi:hypothetical protein
MNYINGFNNGFNTRNNTRNNTNNNHEQTLYIDDTLETPKSEDNYQNTTHDNSKCKLSTITIFICCAGLSMIVAYIALQAIYHNIDNIDNMDNINNTTNSTYITN